MNTFRVFHLGHIFLLARNSPAFEYLAARDSFARRHETISFEYLPAASGALYVY